MDVAAAEQQVLAHVTGAAPGPVEVERLTSLLDGLGINAVLRPDRGEQGRTVVNMSVRVAGRRVSGGSLLDVAVGVLVADPAASLGEVAEAAGIGRTTLHKHYATRDELLRAVGHRALERWEQVLEAADRSVAADGGLRALAEAMVPIGPHMAFLWRTPAFDHADDITRRWCGIEARVLAVLKRAQASGVLRAEVADFWLLQTFYSLVYVAAESVHSGHLAPRDAPGLVIDTLVAGLGVPPAGKGTPR